MSSNNAHTSVASLRKHAGTQRSTSNFQRNLRKYAWFYMLITPGMLYFILFHYVPMWGIVLAFKDYSPFLGVAKSEWVGLAHFKDLFLHDTFGMLMRNSLLLSAMNMILYFPFVIILALILNEVRLLVYKRIVQTIVYMPHFISWVIIAAITLMFFGPSGVINHFLESSGGKEVPFLVSNEWFRPIIVFQSIWKDAGWGTIIFLAALAGVNPELYEASKVDGANRWHRIWNITLPSLKSTIIILLLIRLGNALDSDFLQVFLMANSLNADVSDVFDLYVYRKGLIGGEFSFGVAVGLFKSVIGLILVLFANWMAKLAGEDGIF
ncbi:protein lplB [Paenibacillus swuensis]|uniref:Protein lplB n=1 Tax=Paenibacillus swuensis TaxID=1178515 RepID=A0A172TJ70_9BACL|nr:ABC transporter permease subunit [Paenibacillus swuensis]ANE47091.1 protein lplB [Paenibacillus swuensis]